ncbi:hypothetical protein Tco_0921746 [Tanacetum coccineum]
MVENASGATSMNVPLAGKATASPAEGEKNTKDAEANMQKQLIDLLGIEVDPLDKLNNLANKKRKHADDIHDYFKANKRLHQGPGLDDDARTFSSLLLAEIDNLNPLKQMSVIEQLRQ